MGYLRQHCLAGCHIMNHALVIPTYLTEALIQPIQVELPLY